MKGGSYQAYPEYKDSGIDWLGEIPHKWKISRIKFFATMNPSKSQINDLPTDIEVTFLPMEAIGQHGELDTSKTKRLKNVINGYTYLGEGDVCIAKITPCFENGKGAVINGLKNDIAFATTEVIPFRCFQREDAKYLYYMLTSEPFNKKAEGSMYGAGGQKRVSDSFVANYHFALPPFNERQKIADFLDHETAKIDTLIDKQQQLIKLLKEKRQAVISHAVTKGLNPQTPMKDSGVEWLGEVPMHWVCCSLKHHSRVIDCKHITAKFFDEGSPVASIGEVKEWYVNLDTAKFTNEKYYLELIDGQRKPQPGDIIYSRNATVGEAALVADNMPCFAMGQDVCLIKLHETLAPEYALYVLKSGVIFQQLDLAMVGSTFKRINVDDIRNFSLPVPPYKEQIIIVNELSRKLKKHDVLISKAQVTINLFKERRTALISAAVTGKIDVRNWQAPKKEAA